MELEILKYSLNGKEISKIDVNCWVIVYNDNEIILDIFYNNGTIQTPCKLFAATTEEECIEYRKVITGSIDVII